VEAPPTVIDAFIARARDQPGRLAYTTDGDAITVGGLFEDARRLAGALRARGVGRADRCAVALPTGLDCIRSIYAAQLLGAAPVVLDPDLPGDAMVRRLDLVRPALAICAQAQAGELQARTRIPLVTVRDLATSAASPVLLVSPDPGGTAFLQLTSGSTGEPRAAVITHANLAASLQLTARHLGWRGDDVFASWVPLHHDLGLVRYVFGTMLGGQASHLTRPSMTHLRAWLELLTRVGATVTGGPDSAYRLAARTVDPSRSPRIDLARLRFAGNGGEVARVSTIEAFEARFGIRGVVRPAYGLAEATLVVTSCVAGEPLRVDAEGTVSCGRPLDGVALRIAGSDGRALPPGSAGDLLVRGAPVFAGYFGDAEATRAVLVDGWLRTGDIASVDADGCLFLKGRSRALIKRGGHTIAPREIEDAVNRLAGIAGSAALGMVLSPLSSTEDIVLVVEVDEAADAGSRAPEGLRTRIDAEVRGAIGVPPGRVVLVPPGALPRTPSGKLHYDAVRELLLADGGAERK
jgi:acyl-CoA synthetase (AMP-forming)/AMP-acid ligase II